MAEAGIGLAASLVTLAALFKNCIDCFELYKAAEDCDESLRTALVELDCEKERLLIWAEAVGLVQLESGKRHPHLEDHERVIKAALEQIRYLLDNAAKLQDRYGVRAFDESHAIVAAITDPISKNLATTFKIAYRRFTSRLSHSDTRTPDLTLKIRWAIRDRAKFTGLIVTLKGFIDRLFQIIPISREIQNDMVEADIYSIMNISHLRLVEAACEGSYRAWSDIASNAIDKTERDTIDNNTRIDDQDSSWQESSRLPRTHNLAATPNEEHVDNRLWSSPHVQHCAKLFATVANCASFADPVPCSRQREFQPFGVQYPSYLSEFRTCWDLGERLNAQIDLSHYTKDRVGDLPKSYHYDPIKGLAEVRIYVAPCKRQISIADSICRGASSLHCLDYYVRVDDRLPASCCSASSGYERLSSLLSLMKDLRCSTGWLDRLWLEQRLYDIDGDIDSNLVTLETLFKDGLRNVYGCDDVTDPLAAIMLVGESDLVNKVMNAPPFSPNPRMAQPNQFFRCGPEYDYESDEKIDCLRRTFLGSINVSEAHKKTIPSTMPLSPPASVPSFKRGLDTDLIGDVPVKRVNMQAKSDDSI